MSKKWPDPVTIVIPAYNEERRIHSSLKTLAAFCIDCFSHYEIICVDDGSTDSTWDLLKEMEREPFFRFLRLSKNQGKGYAVKHGMLHAGGRFCFFTDADLPYRLEAFSLALETFHANACDVVTGDRKLAGVSSGLNTGALRRRAGRVFSAIATRLVKMDVYDSQCGFKGFTHDAARQIFSCVQIKGYAFDVEIVAVARRLNLKICRIPVSLVKHRGSKIRMTRDPFFMVLDLLRMVRREKSKARAKREGDRLKKTNP